MEKKWVYLFSEIDQAEKYVGGDWDKVRGLLGGKGANLAEMANLGLPVPPGFTITTRVCALFFAHGKKLPPGLRADVEAGLAVIGEAVGRIASAAEHAGICLRVEADPAVRLLGDRRQLVSALFNLLENAVKYSDAGAEVTVSARAAGDGVELDVADHGIGIPATDLERVFERFYRVDRARSRDTGGTGLGLAIVRHVAQNHGGDVVVRSREGEGSTFTLRLAGVAAVPPVTEHPPIPAST